MRKILSIIILIIFILSFSVSITAFNKPLAKSLVQEKQITAQLIDFFKHQNSTSFNWWFTDAKQIEWNSDCAQKPHTSFWRLCKACRQSIDWRFLTNKDSLPDVFNQEEKSHLVDVKKVLNLIFSVMLVSILFLLVLIPDYKSLIISGIILIIIALIIILMPWSASFTLMHNIFFKDNWQFSADSTIINYFPESVFQAYAVIIFSVILFLSVIFIITGIVMKKYRFLKT